MRWSLIPTAALGVLVLAGCNPVPDYNASALATLRPAASCETQLPFFGHYRTIEERSTGMQFVPANGTIIMRNDGGWCAIRHQFVFNDRPATYEMSMMDPPAHGQILLGARGGELWLAYQPMPGFAGPDFFRARLHSPIPEEIPVHVTVRP